MFLKIDVWRMNKTPFKKYRRNSILWIVLIVELSESLQKDISDER